MDESPGGSQFGPRLPDDDAYWDRLADRIVDSAAPILRERRDEQEWWQPLARWSPAIGVAAAAAALLVLIAGPPEASRPAPFSFEQLLSPDDPLAAAVVGRAPVTDISVMLLVESGGQR